MKHYEEILVTIGASSIKLIEAEPNWEYYYAEFQTPIDTIKGNFLFLKHKFTLKEATKEKIAHWKTLSAGYGFNLITTPKSLLNRRLAEHRYNFGAKSAKTTTKFLKDYFLRDLKLKEVDAEQYFIDPDLKLANGQSVHEATEYLSRNIRKPVHLIVPPNSDKKFLECILINNNLNINFYKKFNYEQNAITKQLLSLLGKEIYNELTLREYNFFKNEIRDYCVYIPKKKFVDLGIKLKSKLLVGLKNHEFLGKGNIWLVDKMIRGKFEFHGN